MIWHRLPEFRSHGASLPKRSSLRLNASQTETLRHPIRSWAWNSKRSVCWSLTDRAEEWFAGGLWSRNCGTQVAQLVCTWGRGSTSARHSGAAPQVFTLHIFLPCHYILSCSANPVIHWGLRFHFIVMSVFVLSMQSIRQSATYWWIEWLLLQQRCLRTKNTISCVSKHVCLLVYLYLKRLPL